MKAPLESGNTNITRIIARIDQTIIDIQSAQLVEDENIIKEIKKGECITNLTNVINTNNLEYGKPPTNLVKCYNEGKISFRTRASPTHSCIVDLNDVSRTILCSYGRMPRLFVSILNFNGYYLRPYTITELQTTILCSNIGKKRIILLK